MLLQTTDLCCLPYPGYLLSNCSICTVCDLNPYQPISRVTYIFCEVSRATHSLHVSAAFISGALADEIDAIAPKRETAQREMERRIVAQMLTCMDDLSAPPPSAQQNPAADSNTPAAPSADAQQDQLPSKHVVIIGEHPPLSIVF